MKKEHHNCPADAAVHVLSGKWKMLILWQLVEKPRRFGELKRSVSGITEKMLIQQLRELEDDSVIHRHDFQEIPPKVEYSLTEHGQKLKPVLDALWQWGCQHIQYCEETQESRVS
jgi:DNA-binding HxlR family transcriptional regulator